MAHEQRYEILKSPKNEQWYWHFKAANGETIASGQGYASRHGALHAISLVQKSGKAKIYSLAAKIV
jgi:uncharacterized protein YegP (UPF0339 family)